MAMKPDFGRVERKNAGDTDKYDVRLRGMPVVIPLLDVHNRGVVLGHITLPHPPNLLLPLLGGRVNRGHTWWERDEVGCRTGGNSFRRKRRGSEERTEGARHWNGGTSGLKKFAAVQHQ